MKIKVIVENVGSNHATVEFEDSCGMEGLESLLQEVNYSLDKISAKKPTNEDEPPKRNDDSNLPTKEALGALWGAAMTNGTDVETVCRQYGVDPKNISKRDCWQMTHDLNERSGYGQN